MKIYSITIIYFSINLGLFLGIVGTAYQPGFSATIGRGDAIELATEYLGTDIDMPMDAYGFVLGYIIKSVQDLETNQLSSFDNGYIHGFAAEWDPEYSSLPGTKQPDNANYMDGYYEGAGQACTMINHNSDYNEYTRQYVEEIDSCLY
jgi:hypothetical protein